MNRQRTAGFLILALALLAVGAGPAQGPVKLAYKFTRGQNLTCVIDATGEGQLTIQENGKQEPPVPLSLKGNATTSARVTQVKPDGTAALKGSLVSMSMNFTQGGQALSMRARDGKVVVTGDGEEMTAPPAARGLFRPTTFRLTKLGIDPDDKKPPSLGFVSVGVEVKADSMVIGTALVGGGSTSVMPLPDHPVKVGDSWSQTAKASLPNDQSTSGMITYTLLGVERVRREQVARIGIKGSAKASGVSVTVAGDGGKPDTEQHVTVDEFTQEIEGTAAFSVTKGRLGKANLTMRLHEVISKPKPTGKKTGTISATAKMTVSPKQ